MYKDKPFGYPTSERRKPWYKRRRNAALVLGSLAGLSWWFGILSPLSYLASGSSSDVVPSKAKSESSWSLFGGGKTTTVDWDERAERVKDAFKLSWAGYEKYAWGMLDPA